MEKLRVVVLMGGKSPEHEVSLISGREVVKHLDKRKYEVLPVIISRDGRKWSLIPPSQILLQPTTVSKRIGERRKSVNKLVLQSDNFSLETVPQRADVAFIAMHGPYGEDGTIQGMLELMGIPYTGAGVLASALGMDKPMFRKVMLQEKIPCPEYIVLKKGENVNKVWKKFTSPVVVKPSSQGSSIGVSIVHKKSQLEKALKAAFTFGPRIIIEEYLAGIEVTCGVLGNENPIALPVVEIIPKKEFFDYEAKYQEGKSEEIVPARISQKLTKEVQNLAIKVFKALGCRGFGRVDMIIREGKPYVLEINTIPGLTPVSLFPKASAAAGISYPQLLDRLIELALESKMF